MPETGDSKPALGLASVSNLPFDNWQQNVVNNKYYNELLKICGAKLDTISGDIFYFCRNRSISSQTNHTKYAILHYPFSYFHFHGRRRHRR